MIHLGDITKIHGCTSPVVDVVIGGSPCQDLSIAGKRAGLAGERSGLYMEQIRVIKEMRAHDRANGRTVELPVRDFIVTVDMNSNGEIVFTEDERGKAADMWNRRADNG